MEECRNRFRVISAIKHFCPATYRWDSGHTPKHHFNLWLVLDGTGSLRTGGHAWKLQAGDCFVLRMWERHVGLHGNGKPLIITSIHFRDIDPNGTFVPYDQIPDRNSRFPIHRRVDDLPFLERLSDRVVTYFAERNDSAVNLWMEGIFHELKRIDEAPKPTGVALEQYQKLQSLCAEIRSHPEIPYRVKDLAVQMNCSPTHLTRMFKQFLKQSPQEFILQSRVDYAKSLLRNSSYTVSQLADLLNYSSPFHFSRQFKEKVGVSPSAFREYELDGAIHLPRTSP